MSCSFVAYIDESGDEGFKFRTGGKKGSSDWFVLSAYITRQVYDLETVKVLDQVRAELGIKPKSHVHWIGLKHQQRVRYVQLIAQKRARFISVCVHKPSLLEPEKFQERFRLYFYAVRYLMERLTWLARDFHSAQHGGDGKAKIIFSHRRQLSYTDLRDYLRRLETMKADGLEIRIEFDCIDIDRIEAHSPGKIMGLQLADAVAGATFNALEKDAFGNTESRYISILLPLIHRHEGKVFGYGLKVVPRETAFSLSGEPTLEWLWKLK